MQIRIELFFLKYAFLNCGAFLQRQYFRLIFSLCIRLWGSHVMSIKHPVQKYSFPPISPRIDALGVVSPTIYSCYAGLILYCKYLHSGTKSSGWLRYSFEVPFYYKNKLSHKYLIASDGYFWNSWQEVELLPLGVAENCRNIVYWCSSYFPRKSHHLPNSE